MLWPLFVPSFAVTEVILCEPARAASDKERDVTRKLLATLSETERSAMWGEELPFDSTALRRSIFMRWRLDMACSNAPTQGPIDAQALDALLQEADSVLAELKDAPDTIEGAHQIWDKARSALARDASKLADLETHFKAQAEQLAKAAATQTAPKPRVSQTKLIAVNPQNNVQRARTKALPIVFVVVVVAGVVFHGVNLLKSRSPPQINQIPGVPEGFMGTSSPRLRAPAHRGADDSAAGPGAPTRRGRAARGAAVRPPVNAVGR
jgi:hypothetical protein